MARTVLALLLALLHMQSAQVTRGMNSSSVNLAAVHNDAALRTPPRRIPYLLTYIAHGVDRELRWPELDAIVHFQQVTE